MQKLFQNKVAQAVLVFLAIVGAYSIFENVRYYVASQNVEEPAMQMDYTGTHIMGNGDVMLGNGEVIPEAVINDDGSVTMPDGTVLEGVMDMR